MKDIAVASALGPRGNKPVFQLSLPTEQARMGWQGPVQAVAVSRVSSGWVPHSMKLWCGGGCVTGLGQLQGRAAGPEAPRGWQ